MPIDSSKLLGVDLTYMKGNPFFAGRRCQVRIRAQDHKEDGASGPHRPKLETAVCNSFQLHQFLRLQDRSLGILHRVSHFTIDWYNLIGHSRYITRHLTSYIKLFTIRCYWRGVLNWEKCPLPNCQCNRNELSRVSAFMYCSSSCAVRCQRDPEPHVACRFRACRVVVRRIDQSKLILNMQMSLECDKDQLADKSDFMQEKIVGCYRLMQSLVLIKNNSRRKPPKVLPQFRVMARARVSRFSDDSSSSSSSTSSPPYVLKRRKLNNSLWVDDDKGSSE